MFRWRVRAKGWGGGFVGAEGCAGNGLAGNLATPSHCIPYFSLFFFYFRFWKLICDPLMKSPSFRIKVECPTLSLSPSPLEFPLIGPEGSEWQMDVRFLPEPPHVPSVRILRRTDTVSAPRYFILRPLKSRWETGVRQERVSGPVEGVPGWERDSVSSNVWLFVVYRPPYPTPHPQPIPRPFLKNALLGPTCKELESNVSLRYNDTVFILNKTLDSSWYRLVNPFVTRFSSVANKAIIILLIPCNHY
jgi:hypothetical protein